MSSEPERHGVFADLHRRLGRLGDALYMFVGCVIAIAVSGLLAHWLKRPLLFPSLGPSAILFFETPLEPPASPRSTLIGHAAGIVTGVVALWLFGLRHSPNVIQQGVTWPRIGAAALALGLTGAVLILLNAKHPPAGATTLLIALGLLTSRSQIGAIAAGVILLTVTSWLINRALGVPVPVWSHPAPVPPPNSSRPTA
jgi:CBS domain-containing membrane protein